MILGNVLITADASLLLPATVVGINMTAPAWTQPKVADPVINQRPQSSERKQQVDMGKQQMGKQRQPCVHVDSWLVAWCPSSMPVYLRDGSAQTIVRAAHWDRSCRSNLLSHPISAYWHRDAKSQRLSYSHRITNFEVTRMTPPGKRPTVKARIDARSAALEANAWPLNQTGSDLHGDWSSRQERGPASSRPSFPGGGGGGGWGWDDSMTHAAGLSPPILTTLQGKKKRAAAETITRQRTEAITRHRTETITRQRTESITRHRTETATPHRIQTTARHRTGVKEQLQRQQHVTG